MADLRTLIRSVEAGLAALPSLEAGDYEGLQTWQRAAVALQQGAQRTTGFGGGAVEGEGQGGHGELLQPCTPPTPRGPTG